MATTSPVATQQAAAAQAAMEAATQVRNSLKQVTQALEAMKAAQAAAASAASASGAVSAGNVLTGLRPANMDAAAAAAAQLQGKDAASLGATSGWQNARLLPNSMNEKGGAQANIAQTAPKAILNWGSFSIGKNESVQFQQLSADSIALNRVIGDSYNGNQPAPSQIMGAIKANGQVWVINQNGIIFTGTSQINVAGLTASSLSISNDRFLKQLATTSWSQANVEPPFLVAPSEVAADVKVEKGASIVANGGSIMLFAPNVTNSGYLNAPNGQVALVAGHAVDLKASNSGGLRGFEFEIRGGTLSSGNTPAVTYEGGGIALNDGLIAADHGNITMAGLNVTQNGILLTSTTVTANGSITLKAHDQFTYDPNNGGAVYTRSGAVTFGQGSVTTVLPDLADTGTITAKELTDKSTIDVQGWKIHLKSGSLIFAPAGDVALTANYRNDIPSVEDHEARIFLDPGSVVDVSGLTDVEIPISQNIIEVELRGDELKDSPVQKNSFLYGKKIVIDATKSGYFTDPMMKGVEWFKGEPGKWYGTPLADMSGYIGLIKRGIAELSTTAGKISLKSTGDIVLNEGSLLAANGGSVKYLPGYVGTTKLISATGRIVSIDDADPSQVYADFAGQFTRGHDRWKVTETWVSPLVKRGYYDRGHTEGKAGGTIQLAAQQGMLFGGKISAVATPGEDQKDVGLDGTLVLGYVSNNSHELQYALPDVLVTSKSVATGPQLEFQAPPLAATSLTLSTDLLSQGGFGKLEVYSNGDIEVAKDANLVMPDGGGVKLYAKSVTVNGNIVARGGTIEMTTVPVSADLLESVARNITIGTGVILDVSGKWINDLLDRQTTSALPIHGGSISLRTSGPGAVAVKDANGVPIDHVAADIGVVTLAEGSLLNASGGGHVATAGKLTAGNGGSITLAGGALNLGGAFTGDALGSGGTLSLTAPHIQVGGAATTGTLLIDPKFFQQGFGSYALNGYKSLVVVQGTVVEASRAVPFAAADYARKPTGTPISSIINWHPEFPAGQRQAVDLSLSSTGPSGLAPFRPNTPPGFTKVGGDLTIQQGAVLGVDPGASLALEAGHLLTVSGTLEAHGGKMSLSLTSDASAGQNADKTQAIWLTSSGKLDVSGTTVLDFNLYGLRVGEVLNGGAVTFNDGLRGSIVTQVGSLIDVSGAVGVLDLPSTANGMMASGLKQSYLPTKVASDAGSITFTSLNGMWLGGSYKALGGDDTAHSGTFAILGGNQSSGNFYASSDKINVVASATSALNKKAGDAVDFGSGVANTASNAVTTFSAADVAAGGFENVNLTTPGTVMLDGGAVLTAGRKIAIQAPKLGVTAGAGSALAQILADEVVIGDTRSLANARFTTAATSGTGKLEVKGDVIDIAGNVALQNIDHASFISVGDLRLVGVPGYTTMSADGGSVQVPNITGTLAAAGNLDFVAAQVYATTLSAFTIKTTKSVAIYSNGSAAPVPLSAGSNLTISASSILQAGVVRAPLGAITFDTGATGSVTLAPGSLTSVSAEGKVIPMGNVRNGDTWYFGDITSAAALYDLTAPPEKKIRIAGKNVDLQKGSRIDVSGGGDATAFEWTPGTGGSRDVLASKSGAPVYAVVPGFTGPAPRDAFAEKNTNLQVGDSVYLAGIPGLPAGWYTLLPGRYALMPGAYRVTLATADANVASNLSIRQPDGSYLVAGKYGVAGTNIADSQRSMFQVMSGDVAKTYSEYDQYQASSFFKQYAANNDLAVPRLAADAGQVVLNAAQQLVLNGVMNFAAGKDGRGGLLDIASESIAVVGQGEGAVSGYTLTLQGDVLSSLGAESLLIGGARTQTSTGMQINPVSSKVLVSNDEDSALVGPEVMLVAKSTTNGTGMITLDSGSVISATGAVAGSDALFIGNANATTPGGSGMGALFIATTATDKSVTRYDIAAGSGPTKGTLDVKDGAHIESDNLIVLDSTGDTLVSSKAVLKAKALQAASSKVSFGATPAGTSGLVLSPETLANLASVKDLTLKSYSTVDFWGPVTVGGLGLDQLTLDGAALVQRGSGDVSIAAQNLSLSNTSGVLAPGDDVANAGTLTLAASTLTVGAGQSASRGFGQVNVAASHDIVFTGTGGFTVGTAANVANLTLSAPRITATGGAQQAATATGKLTTMYVDAPADLAPVTAFGGKLVLTGTQVVHGGVIVMPAGTVRLQATGPSASDGVVLAGGSLIDVTAQKKQFFDIAEYANAGTVEIVAAAGGAAIAQGAVVDLSAPLGGNAGTLSVQVPHGAFTLDGQVYAAATARAVQGSFDLDAGSIADFAALSAKLNAGSFFTKRHFHLGRGDVVLAGMTQVDDLEVVADAGKIIVGSGTVLNADGEKGGNIRLVSYGDLVVEAGATLSAQGSNGKGGHIDLETSAGYLDLAAGSIMNVTGATYGGKVHVCAGRTGETTGTIKAVQLNSTIIGAQIADAEAFWAYNGISTIDQSIITQVSNAASGFMAQAPLKVGNFNLAAGIELTSTGDMTLVTDWDLHMLRPGGNSGYLTLRAAGNLTLKETLSDGFSGAGLGASLLTGRSWSYNLVAGADLAAADVMAVQPASALKPVGKGNLTVDGAALVRTGTGDINLGVGGDLSFGKKSGAIYYNNANPTLMKYSFEIANPDGSIPAGWTQLTSAAAALLYNPNDPSRRTSNIYAASTVNGAGVFRLDGKLDTTYAGWISATGMDIIYNPNNPSETTNFLKAFNADGTLNPLYAGWKFADGGTFSQTFKVGSFANIPATGNQVVKSIAMPAYADLMDAFLPSGMLDLKVLGFAVAPGTTDLIYQVLKPVAQPTFGSPVNIYTLVDQTTGKWKSNTGSNLFAYWTYAGAKATLAYSGGSFQSTFEGQIYTAGQLASPTDMLKVTPAVASAVAGTGTINFAQNGGDLTIAVGGDIIGAPVGPRSLYDWLLRQGGYDANGRPLTAWGPDVNKFAWGIGTIGGGNVAIDAAGNISQLSVVVANSGKVVNGTTLLTYGGGDLAVHASGDANGNFFYVADGRGTVDAGGSLGSIPVSVQVPTSGGTITKSFNLSTILALGAGGFTVTAAGDIDIGAMYNPTMVGVQGGTSLGRADGFVSPGTVNGVFFSTYAADSFLDVLSTGGKVVLSSMVSGDIAAVMPELNAQGQGTSTYLQLLPTYYPPQVKATSLQSDITVGVPKKAETGRLILYPAANGNLTLLAGHSIDLSANTSGSDFAAAGNHIVVSDADPTLLPGVFNPGNKLFDDVLDYLGDGVFSVPDNSLRDEPAKDPAKIHAASLYHKHDAEPVRIYALEGNILGGDPIKKDDNGSVQIVTPKPTIIRAGHDIKNVLFLGQNLKPDDVTIVEAGHNIVFGSYKYNGNMGNSIQIAGPGELVVLAGNSIDLSISDGIYSIGNQKNVYLPDGQGATITVMTGLAGGVDYDAFANKYLNPANAGSIPNNYSADLVAFVGGFTGKGNLTVDDAWALFQALPARQREKLVRDIFFKELKTTGIAAKTDGSPTRDNYNAGYDAIATLFPGKAYSGNLNMLYSQIKTIDGGGINLLVPGGDIKVGPTFVTADMAGTPDQPNKAKKPGDLGLLTLRGGTINTFSSGSVLVNQSRVFTLGGGDIVMWSSNGDIDAGKGAKTALSAPPPQIVYNSATGSFTTELSGVATGSGIGTLIGLPGVPDGDVILMAPHGTVDAGDAGIRVSGDIVIAAQSVRNADNIQVSGTSLGIPTSTPNIGALTSANNTAGASQQTVAPKQSGNEQPSIIIVEFVGFGGGDSEPGSDNGKRRPNEGQQGFNDRHEPDYNDRSAVQIAGYGALSEAEAQLLTAEERQKLTRP
ncbi:filamentous hemagglutinin family protein [Bradyrhizobium sp. Arg237L]|uniref:filamentous haemagglutinin family protein n=1 Tax=Bradyrhizobium sp. Arg237L TaxID=3003352 RepID=UPI00249E6C27|nr:filamentous haemagglutinin family protein [Bradyrhizobium sp. Arg237L]MDI4236717.1 filamentous hemagglutinin family protein [Bradyrhizobium sp. Arg237L]